MSGTKTQRRNVGHILSWSGMLAAHGMSEQIAGNGVWRTIVWVSHLHICLQRKCPFFCSDKVLLVGALVRSSEEGRDHGSSVSAMTL